MNSGCRLDFRNHSLLCCYHLHGSAVLLWQQSFQQGWKRVMEMPESERGG